MFEYIPVELITVLGIAFCFVLVFYAIANQDPPFSQRINHDRAEAQKAEARWRKKVYKSRYLYWYNKSHEVIDGCAAQSASKRDAYARKHAQEDLVKYNYK